MSDKKKILLSRLLFVLEGIISLSAAISSYKVVTLKHFDGYWSVKYLFIDIISLLVLAFLMIVNLKKSNGKLEKIFLTFILPIGLFYMIFMLPTYAPDESAHIWRAYDISQGHIFALQDEKGESIGVDVPSILIDAKQETLNKYPELDKLLKKGSNYGNTTHVITPAQSYFFVFYLPAAIVFFIVRLLNISIIYGIYIAKIANFILFAFAGYYAIKKIPFGKYIIFCCLFLPMVLQQAVSLSADSVINSLVFIYIAFVISLIFQKDKISSRQKLLYFCFMVLITLSKMVYLPIIGLGFVLLFRKDMTKKEKIILFVGGTILCICLLGLGYLYTSRLQGTNTTDYLIENNVNGAEQIKFIIHHPGSYIKMLASTLYHNGKFYISSCIGSPLGWLNIPINSHIINIFLILLILSIFIEDNKESFNLYQKLWCLVIIVSTILLIITGLYITWTSVGGKISMGVQGRYFIPVLPIILLTCSMKRIHLKIKNIEYILPIVLTILNIFVVRQLCYFFM